MANGDKSLGKVTVELEAIDNISKTLSAVQAQLKGMGADIGRATENTGKLNSAFGTMWGRLKTGLTLGLGFRIINTAIDGVVGSVTSAVQGAIDWETQMWRVKVVTEESAQTMVEFGDSLDTIENHLKRVADAGYFGRKATASAFVEFTKQGFGAAESLEALEAIQALSIIGMTDMNTSVRLVASTLHAYQLETEQAWRLTDVFAKAANISALDVEDFGTAMGYVGAFARQLGMSLEDTAAVLTVLSNKGLEAQKAAVYLRRAFSEMVSPTANARAAMDRLNISFTTADGRFKDIVTIMTEINEAFEKKGVSAAERLGYVIDIFGDRAATAITLLLSDVDALAEALEEVEGAAGTAIAGVEEFAETTQGLIQQTSARWEGFLNEMGAGAVDLLGSMVKFGDAITTPSYETRMMSQYLLRETKQNFGDMQISVEGFEEAVKESLTSVRDEFEKTRKIGGPDVSRGPFAAFLGESKDFKAAFDDSRPAFENLIVLTEEMGTTTEVLANIFENAKIKTEELRKEAARTVSPFQYIGSVFNRLGKVELPVFNEEMKDALLTVRNFFDPTIMRDEINKTNELTDRYLDSLSDLEDEYLNLQFRQEQLGWDTTGEQMRVLEQIIENLTDTWRASGEITDVARYKLQQYREEYAKLKPVEIFKDIRVSVREEGIAGQFDLIKERISEMSYEGFKGFLKRFGVSVGDIMTEAREIMEEEGLTRFEDFKRIFTELGTEELFTEMKGGFEDNTLAAKEFGKSFDTLTKNFREFRDLSKETITFTYKGFSLEELGLSPEEIAQIDKIKADEKIRDMAEATKELRDALAGGILPETDVFTPLTEGAQTLAESDIPESMKEVQSTIEETMTSVSDFMGGEFISTWGNVWQGVVDITESAMSNIVEGIEANVNEAADGINHLVSEYNSIAGELGLSKIGKLGHVSLTPVEFGNVERPIVVNVYSTIEMDKQKVAEATSQGQADELYNYGVR